MPVGGFQPVEPIPVSVRLRLGLLHGQGPGNVIAVEADVDFVRVRRKCLQLDDVLKRVIVQPVADANVFKLIDHVPEDGLQLVQTARGRVPAQVHVEGLRVVHLADTTLGLLLAPVKRNLRQQGNCLVVVFEAFD